MDFSSFNIFAIFLATIAGFGAGALWFSPKTFFPLWWRAMGKPADEVPGKCHQSAIDFSLDKVFLLGHWKQGMTSSRLQ